MLRKILITSACLFWTGNALAYLKCDERQSICVVENSNLTLGDQIGFYNSSHRVVALGIVDDLEGPRRKITVTKRYANIRTGHTVALLTTTGTGNGNPQLDPSLIYRDPANTATGASIGIASLSIGDPKRSFEATGYYQWKAWRNLRFLGRGIFLSGNSEVSRSSDEYDIETRHFDLTAFGVLPSVAYIGFGSNAVSLRSEAGLGPMYLSGKVGGSSDLVSGADYETKIENGLTLAGRIGIAADYAYDSLWHGNVGAAYTFYRSAAHTTLTLGIGYDLRGE